MYVCLYTYCYYCTCICIYGFELHFNFHHTLIFHLIHTYRIQSDICHLTIWEHCTCISFWGYHILHVRSITAPTMPVCKTHFLEWKKANLNPCYVVLPREILMIYLYDLFISMAIKYLLNFARILFCSGK